MDKTSVEQQVIKILFDRDLVSFQFNPPYVFTTGLKSPIYIDNRLLISYPKERAFIIDEMVKLIEKTINLKDIDYISSTLSFSAPFGVLIAEALRLPLVLIREKQYAYGKKNTIEGSLQKGKKVLIIEDHMSTAAGVVQNTKAVREAGAEASDCIAITDFEVDVAQKNLKKAKITVHALAKGKNIVAEAIKRKKLSKKESEDLLEWFENPVKWGEKRGYYGED